MKNTGYDQRYTYDLSAFSFMVGNISQLQTLMTIPVVAGDSMSIDMAGVFRLSPQRQNLQLDCQVDLFGFFCSLSSCLWF